MLPYPPVIQCYGRYEVLHKLGHGAMAEVYLARDPLLSRRVALKVLHADLAARSEVVQRFFNEARTVAAIRHPNVVEVFDFGQHGKDMYLVMEFVDGVSLHKILRPLEPTLVAAIICQAAEGLVVAAQNGVVHRDLKPENLLLNQHGYLKISDFGIAHLQDDRLTQTGAILGSPLYMSPEQSQGLKSITTQTDMFSLGAVFYACLAGHPPFQARNLPELFRKITHEPHCSLSILRPDLDPHLVGLIDILLDKKASRRGGGPRWLAQQLKGYLFKNSILDSADWVREGLLVLRAQGVQTTLLSGTTALNIAPHSSRASGSRGTTIQMDSAHSSRRLKRKKSFKIGIGILATGFALLGFSAWYISPKEQFAEALARLPIQKKRLINQASATDLLTDSILDYEPWSKHPSPGDITSPRTSLDPVSTLDDSRSEKSGGQNSDPDLQEPIDLASLANFEITTAPPFAEIFLDGINLGISPLKVRSISVGKHRILIQSKRTQLLDTLIDIYPNLQFLKFKLAELTNSRIAEDLETNKEGLAEKE